MENNIVLIHDDSKWGAEPVYRVFFSIFFYLDRIKKGAAHFNWRLNSHFSSQSLSARWELVRASDAATSSLSASGSERGPQRRGSLAWATDKPPRVRLTQYTSDEARSRLSVPEENRRMIVTASRRNGIPPWHASTLQWDRNGDVPFLLGCCLIYARDSLYVEFWMILIGVQCFNLFQINIIYIFFNKKIIVLDRSFTRV